MHFLNNVTPSEGGEINHRCVGDSIGEALENKQYLKIDYW